MNNSGRFLFFLCALCVLCGSTSVFAATPPAVVEDMARSYVTQQTAVERLKVRRDLLESAMNASRLRNASRDDAAIRNLQSAVAEFRAICASAEREWLGSRVELWTAELDRYDRSVQQGDSGITSKSLHWAEKIGWWCGPVGVVSLLLLVMYFARHGLRRWLGAYAGLTVVLFLGALGIGTATGMSMMLREPPTSVRERVEPPHEKYAALIDEATQKRTALKTEVDQLEHDLEFDARSPGDSESRKASRELAECAAVHAFLIRRNRADEEATADLVAKATASADDAMSRRLLRASTGVGLMIAAGAGGWMQLKAAKKRRRRLANSCPACGQRGVMRLDRRNGTCRCGVAACGFDLAVTHCTEPRLRLCVLGPPGSGKTHLIAAASRELTAGHYPIRGSTTPSVATTAIEQISGAILDERRPPSPTPPGMLPVPLVIRDRDPFGKSDLLVTVGEGATPVAGRHANGYVLTFDATQPLVAHRKWLAELIASRILGRSPIVLALTKIDLVAGRETGRFFADLAAIEPTGRSTNRSVLRLRSARTARFVGVIWPGWDVSADLGRRELPWFPVSPVGLNEPGESDLRRRVIEPFATLEPILGLVHVCGYPVLV
jgi:hypothetical protein